MKRYWIEEPPAPERRSSPRAVSTGQMSSFAAGATSVFDDEEPIGVPTDSFPEIIRLVQAMQLGDEHGVVTPEGWNQGDAMITKKPQTLDEARARTAGVDGCTTWCFSTNPSPALDVEVAR